jgi:hypothetical protein
MRISTIFALKEFVLYSVAYDDNEMEFKRLFDQWISDFEFLEDFFEENIKDLQSGYFGNISIEEAIERTRESAIKLRKQFNDTAQNTDTSNRRIQELFRPLHNNEYKLKSLSKEKSKRDWLRIYAIRISENTYVVSGGAIKLTETMNENTPHLRLELQKLEMTKQFLKDYNLTDESDFGFFEFEP